MANTQTLESLQKLQENIELLESRNAFQDDIIEQLNDEIANHQLQLSELKSQISLIALRIKENPNTEDGSKVEIEPPPPHY